jgi:SAM-dependent methyltransferase
MYLIYSQGELMSPTRRDFSHVPNFTGYMKKIARWFATMPAGMKILDMPAGAGKMREALMPFGHKVVCGDINREAEDYIFVDMSKPLPFHDNNFDAVICLEGLEHLIEPSLLIEELVRITRKGGYIIISTPNITSMFSRLQFLFTGTFYQFNPALVPKVLPGERKDRGHITPLSYFQIRFLFEHFGASIISVDGDKFKKKILAPLFIPIILLGMLLSRILFLNGGKENRKRNRQIYSHMISTPVMLSRSLIIYLQKD